MNEWWTGADSIRCWHVQIGNWRTCELCLLVCLTNFYCGCSTREFFVGMIKAKGLVYTVVTRFEMFISQKWITLVLEWSAQNFNILIKINWWLRREGDTYQLFFVCLSDLLTIFQNSSSFVIYWTTCITSQLRQIEKGRDFFEWFSNSSWTSFSQYEVTRVFRSCEYYVPRLPNSFRNHCTYHFFFSSDFGSPHTHEKLGHEEIPSYARLVCWYNPYSAFSLTRNRFSDDFPRAKNQENWMPNA